MVHLKNHLSIDTKTEEIYQIERLEVFEAKVLLGGLKVSRVFYTLPHHAGTILHQGM